MKTKTDKNDPVAGMIQMAGFEVPDPGITERIMNRIELTVVKNPFTIKPVIGPKGWLVIGISMILLLILGFMVTGKMGSNTGIFWAPLFDSFQKPEGILHFSLHVPKTLIFGMTGLLVCIFIDFAVSTTNWKKHVMNRH
jgi:hypothetical protein